MNKRIIILTPKICLIAIFLLTIFPTFAVTVLNFYQMRDIGKEELFMQTDYLIKIAITRNKDYLEETKNILDNLSKLPKIKSLKVADCRSVLPDNLKRSPFLTNLVLVKNNGEIVCSAIPTSDYFNLTYRDYFQNVLEKKSFSFGGYQKGALSEKNGFSMAWPIFDDSGNIKAILATALDLSWMTELNKKVSIPKGATIVVMDHRGEILICVPDTDNCNSKSEMPLIKKIIEGEKTGRGEAIGLDGKEEIYSYSPLYEFNSNERFYIVFSIKQKEFIQNFTPIFFRSLLVFLLTVFISLVLIKILNKHLVSPQQESIS